MKEVVSVGVMRESDAYTIKNKTDSLTLMKRAGDALFKSYDYSGRTAVVCGKGNNAGDGYVLAGHLKERCCIFLLGERFSEDGKHYFDECVKMGVEYVYCDEKTDFGEFDTIVDCIFGTGFTGEVKGLERQIIDKINESGKFVISCDIPSGLNGDTGKGYSVVSDMTVSIGTIKTGLIQNEAKDKAGKIVNCPIGIGITGEKYYVLDTEDFKGVIPERKHYSHKGTYGYTAVWGGCEMYSGAVKLANMSISQLKSGCGVSRLITEGKCADYVAPYLLESTLFKVDEKFNAEKTDEALRGIKSLAIGMGWGKSEEHKKVLEYILKNYSINLTIDADGLNMISEMDLDILKETKCHVCLTPHPKEFSRLAKVETEEIDIDLAKNFAREYSVVLLLKGTATIVTDGVTVYFVVRGTPAMATAGSGDVLSGILSGLMGYLDLNIKSVSLGAYIAGRSGEEAEKVTNCVSMTSSDTVRQIGKVIGEIL